MKAAVYAGTKNVYEQMIPSMQSLLMHSNVDKIYFLIEDDIFPYELPAEVECINVSNQTFFPIDGPNMKNRCSYMVLLRAAFSKLFPDLDKILTIDNDTIVVSNISNLWDIQLDNYYLAGVPEYLKSSSNFNYINMGVALLNLKKIREDKIDDELIYNLNTYYYSQAEQDCINLTCQDKIYILPAEYNSNWYTVQNKNIITTKIRHFAYTEKWDTFPIIKKYKYSYINKNQPDNYDLDIIIPYYNDIDGLKITLNSIYYNDFPQIHITVVDDCSPDVKATTLRTQYPNVNFLEMTTNSGPGIARQMGLNSTYSPYIMFIDTGDFIINKNVLKHILDNFKEYNDAYVYSYGWLNEFDDAKYYNDSWCLHGSCLKREFLELYNISFSSDITCSYNSEDLGFMKICYLTLKQILVNERLTHLYSESQIVYYRTYNPKSLSNQNQFKTIKGIVYNSKHIIKCCKEQGIFPTFIAQLVAFLIVQLYKFFLKVKQETPNLTKVSLLSLKDFYLNIYRTYEKIIDEDLRLTYSQYLRELLQLTNKPNLMQFIEMIKENKCERN